jgi:hypothetical protein
MKQVEIRVKGHIDGHWSNWLADLRVAYGDHGETILTGSVADQAALYGVIAKLRDLGLDLVSVNRLEGDAPDDR